MSYTNGLDKPTDYFNTVLYTGNGSARSITGVGFQPDWIWVKSRSTTHQPVLSDSVRGTGKELRSDTTDAESSLGNITSFDSDGFSIGTRGEINNNTSNFIAWNWLASNTTASNTDGSITSTVSANTTAGFSIVSYSGNATAGATVGHGLGIKPNIIIIKSRSNSNAWVVGGDYIGSDANGSLLLDTTDVASSGDNNFNNTAPTSSVFTLGSNTQINRSGGTFICYCFTEKKGYSKFGKYTGNGNADGAFIYTGFKPAYFLLKSSSNGESWHIYDNQRANAYNPHETVAPRANDESAESTSSSYGMDFVSNGVKIRGSGDGINSSGYTFIYMAFAESPFVSSGGIPCTAR